MSKLNKFLESFDEDKKPEVEEQKEKKSDKVEAKSLKLQKPAEKSSVIRETEISPEKQTTQKPLKLKLKLEAKPEELIKASVVQETVASTPSAKGKILLSNKEEENTSAIVDEKQILDILFLQSGTLIGLKEKWMELYNQAQTSVKKTKITKKFKDGKFRITNDGGTEILPEFDTLNKTSRQLLSQQWQVSK